MTDNIPDLTIDSSTIAQVDQDNGHAGAERKLPFLTSKYG